MECYNSSLTYLSTVIYYGLFIDAVSNNPESTASIGGVISELERILKETALA
jgi:hypothetical protein